MSDRIKKVNQLIKKEVSKIILKEVDFPNDVLVTLTRVDTSSDLKQARIYISCIPDLYSSRALQILNRNTGHLQKIINKILLMRIIPRINFLQERGIREAARIEEILEEIKRKKKQVKINKPEI